MTAATTSRQLSPALTRRDQVRWTDLFWLAWRQHRLLIGLTALGVLLASGWLWWDAADVTSSGAFEVLTHIVVPASAAVVGVFWGAPLLASEYEQRTNLLVWSQNASLLRWLTAKLVLLGGSAVILWTVLAAADSALTHAVSSQWGDGITDFAPWGLVGFEAWIPLQAIYALFAFALGVAMSAVVRRTVGAMALTLVAGVGVRVGIGLWRPTFLTPLRQLIPTSGYMYGAPQPGALEVGLDHHLNAAGQQVAIPTQCYSTTTGDVDPACAKAHGVVASYVDYQPASRLLTFHLIEFGIFAVLTAALITFAVLWMRRRKV